MNLSFLCFVVKPFVAAVVFVGVAHRAKRNGQLQCSRKLHYLYRKFRRSKEKKQHNVEHRQRDMSTTGKVREFCLYGIVVGMLGCCATNSNPKGYSTETETICDRGWNSRDCNMF